MVELNRFFWFFKLIHILVLELTSWIMHYNRFYIYPMWAYLNNLLHSAVISLFRSLLKMSCTPQTKFFYECTPSQLEACNHCLQSADESCPNRAKTHRSDCQNRVCNHSSRGRNQQSHLASSETPSNLHRLFSDHRTLQIRPNHQDRFYTLHWSCHRTRRLQRSSCKLKAKWQPDNNFFLFLHAFYSNQGEFFVFGTRDEARSVRQV